MAQTEQILTEHPAEPYVANAPPVRRNVRRGLGNRSRNCHYVSSWVHPHQHSAFFVYPWAVVHSPINADSVTASGYCYLPVPIDRLVCELYALTEEEIAIVEATVA